LKGCWTDTDVVCLDNLYRRGSELNLHRLGQAGVQFVRGDVRFIESFPAGPFDFLVDCSAEPSVLAGHNCSSDYLFHTNLVGAYNCLEKTRAWQARLIFLSTSRVYPIARLEAHPWQEEGTRFVWRQGNANGISSGGVSEEVNMEGARSLYGFTKYAAEQLIKEYSATYGLRAVIDRCGVVAGSWQFGKTDQGVLAHWVLAHHFGEPLSYIGYGGTGKQVRDFLHIDDLCDLLCDQVQHFKTWQDWLGNVSGGHANSASLCELTALCHDIMDREVPISTSLETRPSDLRIFIGDCSRLFAKTKWRPQRTLRDIVKDTADWVSRYDKQLRTTLLIDSRTRGT
jgi:CDP-paratose 2-epimerase